MIITNTMTQEQLQHIRATATKDKKSAYYMVALFCGLIKCETVSRCKSKAMYWLNNYRRMGGNPEKIKYLMEYINKTSDTVSVRASVGRRIAYGRDIGNIGLPTPKTTTNEDVANSMNKQELDALFNNGGE